MDTFKFEMPSHEKSIIKVVGVGGGGSNAVTHMFQQGITGVEFVIANTDMQALKSSPVPNRLQIGVHLTEGLGAGANPEVGKAAALESKEQIRELLSNGTKMVFVTAGMGGGTGTGAAPVIAQIAKELGILTVGIVTAPFGYEGRRKMTFADDGIAEMKKYCDTVLVVLNDKLREVYGNLKLREAFSKADDVLTTAAKSIAEIITVHSDVNVDFQDVKTVMEDAGAAVMGSAVASGEGRALQAAEDALNSPLLNDADVEGAQKVLLSVTYSEEFEPTMDELGEITDYIQDQIGVQSDLLIPGYGTDSSLGDKIRVTVIATGFEQNEFEKEPTYFHLDENKTAPKKEEPKQTPIFEQPKTEEPKQEQSLFNFDIPEDKKETEPNPNEPIKKVPLFEGDVEDQATHEENMMNGLDVDSHERQRKLEERRAKLERLSMDPMSDDEIKDKLDVPAYQRRQVKLDETPHSSEKEVSRFRLNDDNEILGDNKFLHDNVD